MRPQMWLGSLILVGSLTLAGCGGGVTKESVQQEIQALKNKAANVKDDTAMKAFTAEADAISKKIQSLPEADRGPLLAELGVAQAAALFRGGFDSLKDAFKDGFKDAFKDGFKDAFKDGFKDAFKDGFKDFKPPF